MCTAVCIERNKNKKKTYSVSRIVCFPGGGDHLCVLGLLPARLGRLDLHRGRRALDGLHLPEPGLLPGEEEGGALQGGGGKFSLIYRLNICDNILVVLSVHISATIDQSQRQIN